MMRDANELAIFDSAHHALRFAYRHPHGDYKPSVLARWQEGCKPITEPRCPSGLDAAALAGWVRQVVEGGAGLSGVAEPYRSIVLARFCTEPVRNIAAKMVVLEAALVGAMGTGLHKRRMVDLLVQRYFGGTMQWPDGQRRLIRQHQIADACDVSQATVSLTYTKVRAWLHANEKEAMERMYRDLQGRGWVS